jgi:hypothetical protein
MLNLLEEMLKNASELELQVALALLEEEKKGGFESNRIVTALISSESETGQGEVYSIFEWLQYWFGGVMSDGALIRSGRFKEINDTYRDRLKSIIDTFREKHIALPEKQEQERKTDIETLIAAIEANPADKVTIQKFYDKYAAHAIAAINSVQKDIVRYPDGQPVLKDSFGIDQPELSKPNKKNIEKSDKIN